MLTGNNITEWKKTFSAELTNTMQLKEHRSMKQNRTEPT